jgi:hypothetical protein
MLRYATLTLALIASTALARAQQSDNGDKSFDVRSSVGDMHVGKDADAGKAGIPLYPGAQPKVEKDNAPLNFGVLTEAFGLKLIVAKYETADAPAKVIAFYRSKLKKYGKVLECHSQHHDAGVTVDDGDSDKDSGDSHELKCDENSGPVTELKVGTEDNQRIVAVEAGEASKGSNFAIVYMHSRGKRGDI